ncbi:hypothetical protein [Nocardioides dongxiaopingii]|uniref:hypothetical protein n=1 Tax=Nocardioides dongxiaopingii TaxID=2576036 RepID=UPI0010C7691D|nr:hypothetical protein [Nocardioides dongxiaopingii]
MMAMPQDGFCFLATTKTGSTSLEAAFQRHAQLLARRPPRMKHMTARTFDAVFAPVLEHYGHPRDSYELLCVVREPVDWVHSWWRYRARPEAAGTLNSTAGVSFEAFAERVVSGEVHLGSWVEFTRTLPGRPPVERIYRYENLDRAAAWMAGRLGVAVPELPRVNVSPRSGSGIATTTRALLEQHFADDVALHDAAR